MLERTEGLVIGCAVGLFIIIVVSIVVNIGLDKRDTQHTPKFTKDQCFTKGLREPWDVDVAGIVLRRGSFKYLVLYASEAEQRTSVKHGWEEDIRTFDSKYIPCPCPASWMKDRNR